MTWTVVATVIGGALTTLVGVVVGGLLGRRSQDRHWLRDTKASAYRALLREYSRIEFDVRRSYLGLVDVTELDWARWGAVLTELSLVADEDVAVAAEGVADVLLRMERYVHGGKRDDDRWRALLSALGDAQLDFVNSARRSLSRTQPALGRRVGGPLIANDVDK